MIAVSVDDVLLCAEICILIQGMCRDGYHFFIQPKLNEEFLPNKETASISSASCIKMQISEHVIKYRP